MVLLTNTTKGSTVTDTRPDVLTAITEWANTPDYPLSSDEALGFRHAKNVVRGLLEAYRDDLGWEYRVIKKDISHPSGERVDVTPYALPDMRVTHRRRKAGPWEKVEA